MMKKWYWPVGCTNTVEDPLVAGKEDLKGFEINYPLSKMG